MAASSAECEDLRLRGTKISITAASLFTIISLFPFHHLLSFILCHFSATATDVTLETMTTEQKRRAICDFQPTFLPLSGATRASQRWINSQPRFGHNSLKFNHLLSQSTRRIQDAAEEFLLQNEVIQLMFATIRRKLPQVWMYLKVEGRFLDLLLP